MTAPSPPYYVRRLNRPGDWNHEVLCFPEQLQQAAISIFKPDDQNEVSLFCIEREDDLDTVAMAIASGRKSIRQEVILLPIMEDELGDVELRREKGATGCKRADDLHYNALITDARIMVSNANRMWNRSRNPHRIKPKMESHVRKALTKGCFAVYRKVAEIYDSGDRSAIAPLISDGSFRADSPPERCECQSSSAEEGLEPSSLRVSESANPSKEDRTRELLASSPTTILVANYLIRNKRRS